MQSRVEDEGLAGDHGPPADGEQGDGQPGVRGEAEELDQVADGVGEDADAGDQHTPEVGTAIAFEGEEDEHDQLEDVVPGNTDKGRNGDAYTGTIARVAAGDPVAGAGLTGRRHVMDEWWRWFLEEDEKGKTTRAQGWTWFRGVGRTRIGGGRTVIHLSQYRSLLLK